MPERAASRWAALISVATLCFACVAARARTTMAENESPGKLLSQALSRGVTDSEEMRTLERIVKEYPDSPWADDALWVLGEVGRRSGNSRAVIYYWQYLMARPTGPVLEEFTLKSKLFKESSLYRVQTLLEVEGGGYLLEEGSRVVEGPEAEKTLFMGCKRFNALPMVVWSELADSYERAHKPALALRALRNAFAESPPKGRWHDLCRQRVEKAERLRALRHPTGSEDTDRAIEGDEANAGPNVALVSPQAPSADASERSGRTR